MLLIGLVAATALWSGVQALNQQARNAYDRAAAVFGGTRTAMLVSASGATFPQELFAKLRRAGWPVSPVIEGRVQIAGHAYRLLGIEPITLPARRSFANSSCGKVAPLALTSIAVRVPPNTAAARS